MFSFPFCSFVCLFIWVRRLNSCTDHVRNLHLHIYCLFICLFVFMVCFWWGSLINSYGQSGVINGLPQCNAMDLISALFLATNFTMSVFFLSFLPCMFVFMFLWLLVCLRFVSSSTNPGKDLHLHRVIYGALAHIINIQTNWSNWPCTAINCKHS